MLLCVGAIGFILVRQIYHRESIEYSLPIGSQYFEIASTQMNDVTVPLAYTNTPFAVWARWVRYL
jgi:hypothetical protein